MFKHFLSNLVPLSVFFSLATDFATTPGQYGVAFDGIPGAVPLGIENNHSGFSAFFLQTPF